LDGIETEEMKNKDLIPSVLTFILKKDFADSENVCTFAHEIER